MEKLQQTVDCELEKKFTLQLELSSTQAELQDVNDQCIKLNAQMKEMDEDHKDEVIFISSSSTP